MRRMRSARRRRAPSSLGHFRFGFRSTFALVPTSFPGGDTEPLHPAPLGSRLRGECAGRELTGLGCAGMTVGVV